MECTKDKTHEQKLYSLKTDIPNILQSQSIFLIFKSGEHERNLAPRKAIFTF